MSIYSKIQSLLTAANATTGESDTTLTDAVQTLVDGYGQGGGGYTDDDLALRNYTGSINLTLTNRAVATYAFAGSGITSVSAPDLTAQVVAHAFRECTSLTTASLPKVQNINSHTFYGCTNLESVYLPSVTTVTGYNFYNCTKLQMICLPKLTETGNAATGSDFARGCTSLKTADLNKVVRIDPNCFNGDTVFDTLILRRATVTTLNNVNAFTGTPFASGGTGGTIYVPSALINSYKSATNWSTLNGYGTVTWTAIENSYYETHYADGTVIS